MVALRRVIRVQVFREQAKTPTARPRVPLVDRGICRAFSCSDKDPVNSARTKCQLVTSVMRCPGVAEARTLGRNPPAHERRLPLAEPVGAGTRRHQPFSLDDPRLRELDTTCALCSRFVDQTRARAELACTADHYAYRRIPSTSSAQVGATRRRARATVVLLGRVRAARSLPSTRAVLASWRASHQESIGFWASRSSDRSTTTRVFSQRSTSTAGSTRTTSTSTAVSSPSSRL